MDIITHLSDIKVEPSSTITAGLLAWYDQHGRKFPWRISPERIKDREQPNPYHVWLSEIMLQQTQAATVCGYFEKFIKTWPDLDALFAASSEEILKAWAGLGYYARARNLIKCANMVIHHYGGKFPDTQHELKKLPGIGEYTSAAIAAIAFGEPVAVIDGNVERVITRLYRIKIPLPQAKPEIGRKVKFLVSAKRSGDFAQAMMDLGATICSPRKPDCPFCPLREHCASVNYSDVERFPHKPAKLKKPLREGAVFVAVACDGSILLQKRPDRGLLASMSEVPTTNWNSRRNGETGVEGAPFKAQWIPCGQVHHIFTHFRLVLYVFRADIDKTLAKNGQWWSPGHVLPTEALPKLMKKTIEAAIPGAKI